MESNATHFRHLAHSLSILPHCQPPPAVKLMSENRKALTPTTVLRTWREKMALQGVGKYLDVATTSKEIAVAMDSER